jgi:predicted ATPase
MMRALSVFMGGWTLGSATAICMESGDEFEVLDLLARLADKSLVVVDRGGHGGAARYRFLETVREYALEQLRGTDEEAALRGRQVSYFLALAETAEKQLSGPKQAEWFTTLETEHANLLASIAWCEQAAERAETALRLAGSISRFWSVRGHYEIARRTLMEALAVGDPGEVSAPRATALVRAAQFTLMQGDVSGGQPLLERAAEIYRALDDQRGVVRTLAGLSSVALLKMDFEAADRLSEESFTIYQTLGQKRGMAISRHQQGFAARCRGDLELSRTRYEEALALLQEVGDQEHFALSEGDLAITLIRLGDHAGARARLTDALLMGRKIEGARVTESVLDGCAELALATGDARTALHFSAAGGRIRSEVGLALSSFEEQEHERFNSAIRESIPAAEAARIVAEAQSVDADTAAAQAYAWLEAPASG